MSIQKGVVKLTGSAFKCINQENYVQEFSTILPRILTVQSSNLSAKLHFYSIQIRGTFSFRTYLADRRQKVEININGTITEFHKCLLQEPVL